MADIFDGLTVENEPAVEQALARRSAELLALDSRQLIRINLDIPSVVATALGALPKIREQRAALADSLRRFDFELVDGLEDYALILNSMHADFQSVSRGVRCSPASLAEARSLFVTMRRYLVAFAERGLVDPTRWRNVPNTRSYKGLGTGLTMLVAIFRSQPELLKLGVIAPAEVERAATLAREMLGIAGQRDSRPGAIARARLLRQRAFTFTVRSYCEARAGIIFVRRDYGDADQLVPSLFGGREYSRRSQEHSLVVAASPPTAPLAAAQPLPATREDDGSLH